MSGRSDLNRLVAEALRHAPEWVRADLAAKDTMVRIRAEETLAAMIEAALGNSRDEDQPA